VLESDFIRVDKCAIEGMYFEAPVLPKRETTSNTVIKCPDLELVRVLGGGNENEML
jgi:hypothetical protein